MDEQQETKNPVEIGEYKGRPIITLNPGERFPFSFGVNKAKLILAHLDDIKAFVEKYEKE
ncbi:hypothetical protein JXO59_05740 [candidate division KSB1 bacterium]|nr:hypothetical protein [candidate division KSB1 bacterium]